MKYGFNMLLWSAHVTQEHAPILKALKRGGYDAVEIPIFEGSPDHYARLGELLDKIGLERSTVSVMVQGKHPLSADSATRKSALEWAKWVVDCNSALGAPILGGPMHSELGLFTGAGPTAAERKRGISFHRALGDHAGKKNVKLSLEALNRFETYFLNTMAQLADYLDEVDHPHIKAMYDTFHANIEEKDPAAAVKTIRRHLIHVHISENDRGTPGKGHIPLDKAYKALRAVKYDGHMTIEAFGRALPALAAATRVWRDFFPNRDEVWKKGIINMKQGWANAK
ncbi:sugar phosphate isomerase/epimerase family protein [Aestuariivirga litoralis]|uniref:sugar phosphate isomerase/epimerase family protein n=1 Tax=Aestuariivirga litoralis TaxID=2650924 RepID=UPI0018C7376F|nr:sugar phosphate isomerase/epimerase [Aestuariivirga litoralis]MBG1233885.1 sugar phosphate isomerase/epimerase [Aestuariivirga litoralis]